MPYQSLQDLQRSQAVTPEQDILLNWFYSNFDIGVAGRRINNVELLHFNGALAGSEFLTYAATKLYLCYRCYISSDALHGINEGVITFYKEGNVASIGTKNIAPYYETTAHNDEFASNPVELVNFYFSRLVVTVYTTIQFTGYRITLI